MVAQDPALVLGSPRDFPLQLVVESLPRVLGSLRVTAGLQLVVEDLPVVLGSQWD